MQIIFGTDGWRGVLDDEINSGTISLVAQAFADYVLQNHPHPKVAIGFDGRRNSRQFSEIFSEVLSGNNIEVYLSNTVCPTPFLSFYVKKNKLNAGVMLTASHNPPEYNGVKFKADYGGPFFTEETLKVEELLGKSLVRKNNRNITEIDFFAIYLSQIEKIIDFEIIKRANLKILIDSMGGSGDEYLENILESHNISATTIFSPPNEYFYGRLAEPIEKNLVPLKNELQRNDYSLGLATDGDADRVGIMLENGEWLSAQETILLLTDFIITKKQFTGSIVKTSSVTDKLKTLFENDERKVIDVQVGFKYIAEEMIKSSVAFGCEESGGFGYGIHMPERDGILSALLIIEMLAHSGFNKISQYVNHKRKEFGLIHYSRIDLTYEKADRSQKLPELFSQNIMEFGNLEIKNVKNFLSSRGIINGIKYIFKGNNRWLLLRSSETEPVIRIYAEGQCETEVRELLTAGKKLIFNELNPIQ